MTAPPWNLVPVQRLPIPTCVFCHTTEKPILVRSDRTEAGSGQLCICRCCSRRFRRFYYVPNFGDIANCHSHFSAGVDDGHEHF